MKYRPAEVRPSSSVTTNSPGSSMADAGRRAAGEEQHPGEHEDERDRADDGPPVGPGPRAAAVARAGSSGSEKSLTKSAVIAPNAPSARGYGRPNAANQGRQRGRERTTAADGPTSHGSVASRERIRRGRATLYTRVAGSTRCRRNAARHRVYLDTWATSPPPSTDMDRLVVAIVRRAPAEVVACPLIDSSGVDASFEAAGVDAPLDDWLFEVRDGGGITCAGSHVGFEDDPSFPQLEVELPSPTPGNDETSQPARP